MTSQMKTEFVKHVARTIDLVQVSTWRQHVPSKRGIRARWVPVEHIVITGLPK